MAIFNGRSVLNKIIYSMNETFLLRKVEIHALQTVFLQQPYPLMLESTPKSVQAAWFCFIDIETICRNQF